ncbi:hypothetical protein HaLaN_15286 [Haematococcus lacustris]|uniref:Uncharacterized protein n=1 Tax=Haematococcus lacustris TaxID=44745 RepID=A0A699Z784_HAELA|nr:hypothetical protein HaLaN_15286 [Haematococcus lacustris]
MSRPKDSKPEQIWDVDFESETLRELAGRSRRRNQTFTCRPSPPPAPLQQTYSGGTLDLTPLPMTALRGGISAGIPCPCLAAEYYRGRMCWGQPERH